MELNKYLTLSNDRKEIVQQLAFKYCTDAETFRKIYKHCLSDTARKCIDFSITELHREQISDLPAELKGKLK